MNKNDIQRIDKKEITRNKIMIKKVLYTGLEALGLISILFGMMAVYKETGLHDLWIEFITKLI